MEIVKRPAKKKPIPYPQYIKHERKEIKLINKLEKMHKNVIKALKKR